MITNDNYLDPDLFEDEEGFEEEEEQEEEEVEEQIEFNDCDNCADFNCNDQCKPTVNGGERFRLR